MKGCGKYLKLAGGALAVFPPLICAVWNLVINRGAGALLFLLSLYYCFAPGLGFFLIGAVLELVGQRRDAASKKTELNPAGITPPPILPDGKSGSPACRNAWRAAAAAGVMVAVGAMAVPFVGPGLGGGLVFLALGILPGMALGAAAFTLAIKSLTLSEPRRWLSLLLLVLLLLPSGWMLFKFYHQ